MNWSFFKLRRRGPLGSRATAPLAITPQQEIRLAPAPSGLTASVQPATPKPARSRSSWFGWLWGRNRRRDASDRWVQGELLLQQVRPLRNDFRENNTRAPRRGSKVLHETPLAPERRDDQDLAWNRLRNRNPESLQISSD